MRQIPYSQRRIPQRLRVRDSSLPSSLKNNSAGPSVRPLKKLLFRDLALQADTLVGSVRRRGLALGIGNVICQKLESLLLNSTPTNTLPSRRRWTFTTWHSTLRLLFSFTSCSICPTTTTCDNSKQAPCWPTEMEFVCTQNRSLSSVCPRTDKGTVRLTRWERRRSLQRKCKRDIRFSETPNLKNPAGPLFDSPGPAPKLFCAHHPSAADPSLCRHAQEQLQLYLRPGPLQ
jgi:hypothetical protein